MENAEFYHALLHLQASRQAQADEPSFVSSLYIKCTNTFRNSKRQECVWVHTLKRVSCKYTAGVNVCDMRALFVGP